VHAKTATMTSRAAEASQEISFPPPSILVDTEAIVDSCEMAEMTIHSPSGDSGEGEASSSSSSWSSPPPGLRFVEVAELAALLHLGEYVHARHLWRRHRPSPSSGIGTALATTSDDPHTHSSSSSSFDPEFHQFALLWSSAARPILSDDVKLAHSGLNQCASSGLEPLATYASELKATYRERCARRAERSYSRMTVEGCRDWFGYADGKQQDEEDMGRMLSARGWTRDGEGTDTMGGPFWIPPPPGWEPDGEEEDDMEMAEEPSSADDFGEQIRSLTKIVSFLERKKLNA